MNETKTKYQLPIHLLIIHEGKSIFEKTFKSLPVTIGRSNRCDITLTHLDWISRQHAIITLEGEQIYLVDLKSSNGIHLGGHTYDKVEIHNNTTVHIGSLILHFKLSLEKKKLQNQKKSTQETPPPPPTDAYSASIDDRETVVNFNPHSTKPALGSTKKERFYPELDQESLQQKTPGPSPKQFQYMPTHTMRADQQRQQKPVKKAAAPFYMREEVKRHYSAKPSQPHSYQQPAQQQKSEGLTGYIMERDRPLDGISRVPRERRVLEAYVTWKGELLDTHMFWPGEQVVVGRTNEGLYVPTLKGAFLVAYFDGLVARCSIPERANGFLRTEEGKLVPLSETIKHQSWSPRKRNYVLKLGSSELCSLKLDNDIQLYFRYAPAPRQLSKKKIVEPDALLKKTMTGSGLVHFLLIMICILFAPQQEVPKVKNLPPRIAKLLVKKEKPKPKSKPKPKKKKKKKKNEKKVTKKKTKKQLKKKVVKPKKRKPKKVVVKRRQRKPKRVVIQKNTKVREMNRRVTRSVTNKKSVKGQPTKDFSKVGALAALGALGAATPNPSNKAVSININKRAGGSSSKVTTSGVIGAIKAKGGKLQSAGFAGIKTKGKGFGTGTGYGVQGIKGRAGSRGVAGSVVGTPKLMKIKKTEGLSRKQVMDVVKNYLGKIQQCYERSLLTHPGMAGRVEYEWLITPKGRVKWSKVKKSEMRGGDSLNACILAIFKKMKFPVAKNGQTTRPNIGFPFGRF